MEQIGYTIYDKKEKLFYNGHRWGVRKIGKIYRRKSEAEYRRLIIGRLRNLNDIIVIPVLISLDNNLLI